MRADLRTPPTTTTSAVLHTMSWHSRLFSLRPAAALNTLTVKLNKASRGSGPLDLPPNVLSGAPFSLILDKSHCGICPAYNRLMSSLNALAHPFLLSATLMTVSVSSKLSPTSGSLLTDCRSTLKPTPVPHISTYSISSNTRI